MKPRGPNVDPARPLVVRRSFLFKSKNYLPGRSVGDDDMTPRDQGKFFRTGYLKYASNDAPKAGETFEAVSDMQIDGKDLKAGDKFDLSDSVPARSARTLKDEGRIKPAAKKPKKMSRRKRG